MISRRWSVLAISALACGVVAQAQTSTTSGAIKGTVKSKRGGALAGATLILRNPETGFARTTKTDGNGAYQFSFILPGSYELTVTSPGLRSAKDSSVRVSIGVTAFQNFDLDAAEATAIVEVVAESGGIDSAQINTQSSIGSELVEAIPVNERNFVDLARLTPGVAAGNLANSYLTTAEGARGVQNNLQIDGASYNSKFNGFQRGGTRSTFSFGQDSIKELQVITNNFEVNQGDSVGAVINAVTKTGTNQMTGMVFSLFRPSGLVAKIQNVPYDPGLKNNNDTVRTRKMDQIQGGFNLGGPIIKDKLHFFINVEAARKREQTVPTFTYSGATGNQVADFDTFFGAGGMGSTLITTNDGRTAAQENGTPWTDEQKNLAITARLDWMINNDHRAVFRMNLMDYKGLNDTYAGQRRPDVAYSNNSSVKNSSFSYVLELNSNFGQSLLNEARIQISSERGPIEPNSTASSSFRPGGSFYAGQSSLDPRTTDETSTQIQDNLTLALGEWTFQTGVDIQLVSQKNRFLQYGNGSWSFSTFATANHWFSNPATWAPPTGTVSYNQNISPLNGVLTLDEKFLAGYLQAKYGGLFNKRLLMTFGVRYTAEIWGDNPNPNPRFQGLDNPANDSALDPRFGFTFDLFGNSKTVLRGGFGWFSVSNPGQTANAVVMNNGINILPFFISSSSNPTAFQQGNPLSMGARVQNNRLTPLDAGTLMGNSTFQDTVRINLMDPEVKMARARAISLGIEHDMGNGFIFGVRTTFKKFNNLQYATNINLGQYNSLTAPTTDPNAIYNDGYPTTTNRFSTAARPGRAIVRGRLLDLTGFGDVSLSRYDGEGRYRSLVIELNRQTDRGWNFKSNVTFAKAEDNNSNERATLTNSSVYTPNPASPLEAFALSDNDRQMRGVLAIIAPPVFGVRVSGIFTYSTGLPWTATYSTDQNGDGQSIDYMWGRNTMRQLDTKSFDLRISRNFRIIKHFSLEGIIDVYNVFNWANQWISNSNRSFSTGPTSAKFVNFAQVDTPDQKTREVQFTLKARF